MLIRLHKNIVKYKIMYIFYVVMLHFFLLTPVHKDIQKISSKISEITYQSITELSPYNTELNSKKVDRFTSSETTGQKVVNGTKFIYTDTFSLERISQLNYIKQIDDYISIFELTSKHIDFRSPPFIKT